MELRIIKPMQSPTKQHVSGIKRRLLSLILLPSFLIPIACSEDINQRLDGLQEQIDALKSAQSAFEKRLYVTSVVKNDEGYQIFFSDGTSVVIPNQPPAETSDIFIRSINVEELVVSFILSNGEKFDIPLYAALSISFDNTESIVAEPEAVVDIGYTVSSRLTPVTVEVLSSPDIQARVLDSENTIQIKFLKAVDEYSKVIVFASNGEKVVIKTLTFENAQMQVNPSDVMQFGSEGGTQDLSIITNLGYRLSVPEGDKNWLQYTETRAVTEHRGVVTVAPNESYDGRESIITIYGAGTKILSQISVQQSARIGLNMKSDRLTVLRDGGVFSIPFQSNSECSIAIPPSAKTWIARADTRGLVDREALLSISPNDDDEYRKADLQVICGSISMPFHVIQFGVSSSISIEHMNKTVVVPSFAYSSLPEEIVVDWGDGTSEDYVKELAHEYENSGLYTMTVTSSSESFPYVQIPALSGIQGIDFSKL